MLNSIGADEEINEYFEWFRGVDLENNPSAAAQKLTFDLLLEKGDTLEEMGRSAPSTFFFLFRLAQ